MALLAWTPNSQTHNTSPPKAFTNLATHRTLRAQKWPLSTWLRSRGSTRSASPSPALTTRQVAWSRPTLTPAPPRSSPSSKAASTWGSWPQTLTTRSSPWSYRRAMRLFSLLALSTSRKTLAMRMPFRSPPWAAKTRASLPLPMLFSGPNQTLGAMFWRRLFRWTSPLLPISKSSFEIARCYYAFIVVQFGFLLFVWFRFEIVRGEYVC